MLNLKVQSRQTLGKNIQSLRVQNKVPAILYGPKITKPLSLEINLEDFEKVYKDAGQSTLIHLETLGSDEGKEKTENVVLIHDIQRHPVSRRVMHVDFYQVPLDKKITIMIPLEILGEAPAVRDEGGILVRNVYEVEIRALPTKLPAEMKVSISNMSHIGDAIHVRELVLDPDVEILNNPDEVLVSIAAPKEEVVEETVTEAPEENLGEIKTEGEVKRAEEEAKKTEEAAVEK